MNLINYALAKNNSKVDTSVA